VTRPEFSSLPNPLPTIQLGGPDPLVALPATLSGAPGQRLSIPVNLDTAAGMESVELRIGFDATSLEVLDVRRGSLTGDFQWFMRRDEPGLLHIDMASLHSLSGGSGSLLELDVRIKSGAQPGISLIDLQWAALSDGRLTLNPEPKPGPDPTDARLLIAASHTGAGAPAWVDQLPLPAFEVARPLTSKAVAAPEPVIAWTKQANLTLQDAGPVSMNRGWLKDFVNGGGQTEEERKPNDKLRVLLPKVTAALTKGLSKLKRR
jgi:hypothetical protein